MAKQDQAQQKYKSILPAGLYLVSTPIGNLGDITLRALDVLRDCDVVSCEDTRTSAKLLRAHNIQTRMSAYHDHSDGKTRDQLISHIQNGGAIALISDAGTPLISDPGYRLVNDAIEQDLSIIPIPGANAPLPALQLSGLPSDKFTFCGFIPHKQGDTQRLFESLSQHKETLIFYDTTRRIHSSLTSALSILGDRKGAIVREITKMHEASLRGSLSELLHQTEGLRGELVLLIEGAQDEVIDDGELMRQLRQEMQENSLKTAVANVAKATGASRNHVYQLGLSVRDEL